MKQTIKWIKENKWSAISIVIVLLAIIIGSIRSASAYDSCMSGSWHDPTVQSEGIDLQVLNSGISAKFYSYGEKSNNLRWYYMNFDADGVADVGTVKNKVSRDPQKVGRATFDVISNVLVLILMYLTIYIDDPPWCFGCEKTLLYTRITQPVICE